MAAIATAQNENYMVEIFADECMDSPRDDDHLGHIVGWHQRYTVGDEQPGESPREWVHSWKRGRKEKDYVILPVYMIDHSGVALSTASFSCPWDSGQVGFIYATRERAEAGGYPWGDREYIEGVLQAEIAEYSAYMNGECYGFAVFRKCGACRGWEALDSCGGFLGSDFSESGLLDAIRDALPEDAVTLVDELR